MIEPFAKYVSRLKNATSAELHYGKYARLNVSAPILLSLSKNINARFRASAAINLYRIKFITDNRGTVYEISFISLLLFDASGFDTQGHV